jgi:tRNA (guanine-N7-)-methyltransferase
MKTRVRHHVNPLQSHLIEPRRVRLDLPKDREIEVEIGCADALFLFERAEKARQGGVARCEVGLEIRKDLVDWVNDKARTAGLDVRAFFSNVNVDLEHYFAAGSVARFFVNFPDPYFKRAQHKRRVMQPGLVEDMWTCLSPGGELFFQSDVWDLALDAMEEIERRDDLFANLAGPWSFWKQGNPFGCRSKREVDCAELGRAVWRMRYRKLG